MGKITNLPFDQHGFQFCHSHAYLEGPLSTGVIRDVVCRFVRRVSQNGSGLPTHGSGPRRKGVVCRSVRRVSQNGSGPPTHGSGLSDTCQL
ncbi:hypothetical protein Hanom_Chr09g00867991 [Helianthus anomalus]